MKPLAWSLVVTGVAAALFLALGDRASDTGLRTMGLAGGAAVALAGVALGLCRRDSRVHWDDTSEITIAPRFFLERRRAPRHSVRTPVTVSVNGESCNATLLSVSASGALLRLRVQPGRQLHAELGQPVRITDYPAGVVARVGTHGLYVDFAVAFDRQPASRAAAPEPELSASARG